MIGSWSLLAGEDRSAALMLDDLLSAQDRLAAAEFSYLEAQLAYMLSQIQLKKAMGILLTMQETHSPSGVLAER